ncbi:hypothetical protein C0581_02955 [Candidatus Parcubacteria bacterium]|nr:MAG: hypothetical protein C0581_02955 [Candidatus Parcubacteria bacterium]
MSQKNLVSIIIRAKNEEDWIGKTLEMVHKQTYTDFEVILVDNASTDTTVEIGRRYGCKIISVEKYIPGKLINEGIRGSRGSLLAILSAHCVPCDEHWLENLVTNFEDEEVAGVYGRQLPLPETSSFDKRDLVITFGPEKKIQRKDSFFHNANSMIRRSVWEDMPFDEKITNIEDRVWASEVLKKGYKIIYEPESRVFHHHGIHQYGNVERCESTVTILDSIEDYSLHSEKWENGLVNSHQDIVAIVPILESQVDALLSKPEGSSRTFFELLVDETKKSNQIKDVVISTGSDVLLQHASRLNVLTYDLNNVEHHKELSLEDILKSTLLHIEIKQKYTPEYIMYIKPTHAFRTVDLINEIIRKALAEKADSVFVAKKDYKACWSLEEGKFVRKDSGFTKRSVKEPLWLGYTGVGNIIRTDYVRKKERIGESVSIVNVEDGAVLLDISEPSDLFIAKKIYFDYFKQYAKKKEE